MKLIDAEYTFDGGKLLFYFTADGRVDFRELVKDLAGQFRTRIELRQIGVRDETKIIGGIGICGREFCCHAYLSDFAPVSIRMAKEQNLSLNPAKISGVCGRLMCCLRNEQETYEYVSDVVWFEENFVEDNSRLKNVRHEIVKFDEWRFVDVAQAFPEYPVDELSFRPRKAKGHGKGGKKGNNDESADEKELKELENLEEKEGAGSKLDE